MNKEGSIRVKNYRGRKVIRTLSMILVATTTCAAVIGLPIFDEKSIVDKFFYNKEKSFLEQMAQQKLPIDLKKGMERDVLGLKLVYPNGKEERIDFEMCKKLYDYNPAICERQVRVLYNSTIIPCDGYKIEDVNGKLMAFPVTKTPEKKDASNGIQKLEKTIF